MNIRAAIIGMGIGKKHLEAIEGYKNSKVLTICEKDPKKITQLKKKYPNKNIVSNDNEIFQNKNINLVSIASYDNYHYKQVIKSIKAKKNIIVEKPICLKRSELKNIYNLLKKNPKIKITSNLVLRTNDLFLNFKKNINSQKVLYIEADYICGRKYKLSEWRSNVKGYSITLGAAIHMFDLIMWFLKLRPKSVQAFGSKKGNTGTSYSKNSLIVYILEFPHNIIVKITANAVAVYNHFHELRVYQEDKTMVNSILGAFSVSKDKTKNIKKISLKYPDKRNRKKLIQNFIDILKKKKVKPIITLREQIDLMSVCFAADESLKFGKKIMIRYI